MAVASVTISFPVATGYHKGFTCVDDVGDAWNFNGSTVTFATWQETDPITGEPIPWLTKTNAPGGGIRMVSSASGVFIVDFASADTINRQGVYPYEIKTVDSSGEPRQVAKGFLVLIAARFDP